jgi:hypothetical protein
MTRTRWMKRTAGMQWLAAALLVASVATANAEGLTTAGDMQAALAGLGAGRDVEIVLANGKSYRGKLGTVGKDTVLLTQITGKEFYDVLIDLDAVAAVELRVRGN